MNKFFIWLVCFLVFVPLGADLAVLSGYDFVRESWWQYIVLILITLITVFTDGFSIFERGS